MNVLKKFATFALASVFIITPMANTDARAYDRGNNTKVSTERKSFRERVDAIMKEIDNSYGFKYEVLEGTPVITSIYDESIMGRAMATEEQCVKYLLKNNPSPKISVSPEEFVALYYEEASKEGIRPDVAFSQALHETGFFRYGGTVTPDQNNFCGLGTTSSTIKGHYFPNARIGIRAHIQHIMAYTTSRPPRESLVDPRYQKAKKAYGNLGITNWNGLNGRWAVPGNGYGNKVMDIFRHIMAE